MHDVQWYHRYKQIQWCCCWGCCCLPITSLIVIELRFIALFIISCNHTASLVISIPIKVDMENNQTIWNDKEDSLFGFTLQDILTSRKKLKWLIESVKNTCLFPSKPDDIEKVYNSPEDKSSYDNSIVAPMHLIERSSSTAKPKHWNKCFLMKSNGLFFLIVQQIEKKPVNLLMCTVARHLQGYQKFRE